MLAFTVDGVSLLADISISGTLAWPDRRMVVVSDRHFEKGSFFAARGAPLPPYDTAATLDRLTAWHRPETEIRLGDNFRDQETSKRLAPALRERIRNVDGFFEARDIGG